MSKRILIAEDSSVILNLTKKILGQQNYNIDTVKNGEEALKKTAEMSYDLILLDIHMPKMNGMECAIEIRKSNKKIPILAITGNASNFSKKEFNEAGIDDFIPKPLNYDEVLGKVNQYLKYAD